MRNILVAAMLAMAACGGGDSDPSEPVYLPGENGNPGVYIDEGCHQGAIVSSSSTCDAFVPETGTTRNGCGPVFQYGGDDGELGCCVDMPDTEEGDAVIVWAKCAAQP